MGKSPRMAGAGWTRRDFLKLSGLTTAAVAAPWALNSAQARIRTSAHFVIAGAGTAGLAAAARLSRRFDGARITLIDSRETHWYQPGFPLIASGLWELARVTEPNAAFVPRGVDWQRARIAEFDPDANQVVTDAGQRIRYDYLIVATGLDLDYHEIEGMEVELIGRYGIGSVYAGPEPALATWRATQTFIEQGGVGLFGRPSGDIKCAGAPLKMILLTYHRLQQAGREGAAELIYAAHDDTLFAVPPVNDRVQELFVERGIDSRYSHELTAIDPGRREATYQTPDGAVTLGYDYLHVVPPMSPTSAVADSALAWQEGPFAAKGWLEVDQYTLQHRRYPNVFGIGDVNGVPRGKTAASVKTQAPVALRNLERTLQEQEPDASYNGYTSCPLITRIGQAMLVEFDYEGNLIPSFPFIDPLEPHWVPWLLEEVMLKPAYDAVLRGRI